MANKMTDKKAPNNLSVKPVIYVHAKGRGPLSKDSARRLLKLGLPVCSRLAHEGMTATTHGYDQLDLLVSELAGLFPARPLIFLRAGLLPSRQLLETLVELLEQGDQLLALSVLSNADTNVNPFARLNVRAEDSNLDLGALVNLLAPGQLHTLTVWTGHFTILSTSLVAQLSSEPANGSVLHQIQAAGGALKVPDHLFLHDPDSRVFKPMALQPHETEYPPPFGELSSRLQNWLDAGITGLPFDIDRNKPATLHITHSWGGGIAQWIHSFIKTDQSRQHFQMRSEGLQTGRGYGQKICLFAGNELRCPIASWWLSPPIESVIESSKGYQDILSDICNRFGIGRIFVSSLVGHSLDALRSGLPTLQILHDNFPIWPLLSVNPEPYLNEDGDLNLKLALEQHKRNREFTDKNARAWSQISKAYMQAIDKYSVMIAAPSLSVLDLQNRLEPAFKNRPSEVIPHGIPDIDSLLPTTPRSRHDGRLRLVILGRMQTGKGQALLLQALPELARYVQVYLLGAGKSGEAFFGVSGVDVILEYDRNDLSSIMADIGPDFAALTSVVPETFSFTLSELQQMQIPVIATRVGSFPNRIEHGQTGWLVETNAQALVRQVEALCIAPDQIETVRKNLKDITAHNLKAMIEAYDTICPLPKIAPPLLPSDSGFEQAQRAASDFEWAMAANELQHTSKRATEFQKDAEQKTRWALDTNKQLKALHKNLQSEQEQLKLERKQNTEWVEQLESEIARLLPLSELGLDHPRLAEQNALIVGSISWKITRPLRAARRVVKNLMLARAWNPLRWPWLISQFVRNLSTLGMTGTLERLQTSGGESVPEPVIITVPKTHQDIRVPSAFPEHAQPKVSIIIPVYNKWEYTAACLCSLLDTRGQHSFEVIIVDDRSSDETADQLAQIEGLTHLRNDTNLGFVGSCNRGARHARGEYLVMLNNDTQATAGWLDELIATFERYPEAGLVGSRLIYPDGSLQESGGIVFNDGSAWNYGRDKDSENPEYHFLREVDYCSGACIALKTEYFHRLGLFDERYAPAYYEDTDLAFRVRQSGLKVLVQPASIIVHHEGVSSGTDTSSGAKKYQLINQEKFLDRWQNELKLQPEKVSDTDNRADIFQASQFRNKARILFIDISTPVASRDSASVRLINLMQCCKDLGYGVTFFADNREYAGDSTRDLQKSGIEVLYQPWLKSLKKFFEDRGNEFDFVFISRHYVAINYISLLKRFCPDAHFIFDTVDLHYLREQRLAELEQSLPLKRTAQQTRRSELSVIKAADTTLVLSDVEKKILSDDAPGEKLHILSNIHQVPGRDTDFESRKDIFFVGGYKHPPNVDAACWFVNSIWPLIRKQLPSVCFHLVGSYAPERVRSLTGDGVIFHGFVESMQPFLSDCRLAVAPLRYGAGVKGKVNMSMAHGQPMVATPIAIEGMFAQHGREILVADDAESFANEVVGLYKNEVLWNQLSDASVQNAEEHFSMSAARASLTSLFNSFET